MHIGYIKTPLNIHMKSRCIYGEIGYVTASPFLSPTASNLNQPSSSNFTAPYIPHNLPIYVPPILVPPVNPIVPPRMARYPPLNLPIVIYELPLLYAQRIRQFKGERGYSTEEQLEWFSDWTNLEDVEYDDVKFRLVS